MGILRYPPSFTWYEVAHILENDAHHTRMEILPELPVDQRILKVAQTEKDYKQIVVSIIRPLF